MLLVPPVDVTKGEPHPFCPALHPLEIVGGLVALIRKVASSILLARQATYVLWLVR
jgi:hypothetical protein